MKANNPSTKIMRLNLVVVTAIAMAYAQIPATLSFYIHLVGGKAWDVPTKPNHYETWAKGEKFTKDDILVFDFCTGMHTVAEVPKVAYDTCNTTAAKTIETLGPTTVTVSNVGMYFFICTKHCQSGQKVAIDVKPS
ncbi:putative Phytocyanin domain, cupredoxin [Helianthus annuus]|nr:putative Phytocyanin domain, cupredoxin [Helianthus annuus]